MPDYLPKLEFNPYIAPYVGSATKELDTLGQTLDKRYETNIAAMDQLDMLMQNVNVLGNDSHLKDKLLNETRNQIKGIRDAGNWENSRNHIREIARRFNNDSILKTAQTNFTKAEELQKKVEEMKLRGETPILFSDPQKFSTIGKDGKARSFTSDVEKQLDWRNDQATFFDQIESDSYEKSSSSYGFNKKTGVWEQNSSGRGDINITEKKIIAQANRSVDLYLERPTGKQQMRVLMEKEGLSYNEAKEQLRQEMIATGKERVFNKSSRTDTSTPFNGAGVGLGSGTPAPKTLNTVGNEIILNPNVDSSKVEVVQKEDGSFEVKSKDSGYFNRLFSNIQKDMNDGNIANPSSIGDYVSNTLNGAYNIVTGGNKLVANLFKEQTPEEAEKFNKQLVGHMTGKANKYLKETYPNFDKLPKQKQNDLVKKASSNLFAQTMSLTPKVIQYADDKQIKASNEFNLTYDAANNSNAWVVDKGHVSKIANLDEAITGAYGDKLTRAEIKKMITSKEITVTGKLSPDNPITPAALVLKVPNIDGGFRTVYVDGNDSEKSLGMGLHIISKLKLSGGGQEKDSQGNTYTVSPVFDNNQQIIDWKASITKK